MSRRRRPRLLLLVLAILSLPIAAEPVRAGVTIEDIGPDVSHYIGNGAAGRINDLAVAIGPNNTLRAFAASEWGGLSTSQDGGRTWSFLTAHVPLVMQDVAVDPSDASVVYATSLYDGRSQDPASGGRSGIQVSWDGGDTWTRPPTAIPPPGFNCPQAARDEPAAFGIDARIGAPVVVGTNCGVAISIDAGASWSFADPTPADPAGIVWDVSVQPGGPLGQGIIDVCGQDGHWRSVDGGQTWTGGGMLWPAPGRCSIAVSPDEQDVVFITDASVGMVYESDDGGAHGNSSWVAIGQPSDPVKRIPFVVTNKRSDVGGEKRFDLWYGSLTLWRATCRTPVPPDSNPRCETPDKWTRIPVDVESTFHGDMGDLEFDPRASIDACPVMTSSDGGVYYLDPSVADCQTPAFMEPDVAPHAAWLWGMDGANQPGGSVDLYFGTQDIGEWGSRNAEASVPITWVDLGGDDSFGIAADTSRVVYYHYGGALFLRDPGLQGGGPVNLPAACSSLVMFRYAPDVARFGDRKYVVLCECGGVWVTHDITAVDGDGNPAVVWEEIGAGSAPPDVCGIRPAISPTDPTQVIFYLQARKPGTGSGPCWQWKHLGNACNQGSSDNVGDGLYRYVGFQPGSSWERIDTNPVITHNNTVEPGRGGIGVFGVDPTNANRLYASNLRDNGMGPRMIYSVDGGATWHEDPDLDRRMTADGVFPYSNQSGPTTDTAMGFMFSGYPQPSLVAFDPYDPDILVAGGRDSGLFLSTNGGQDWGLISDPFDPAASGVPHIPRPWFAHFRHEPGGAFWLYVGTQGRGVWRLRVQQPTATAGGPYSTLEGTNVILDASGSSDPDGMPLSFEWDLDNDGIFDGPGGPTAVFDRVGQDGVYGVRVKVSAGGVFSIAEATVTVLNVPPAVSAGSNAPKDENSPVTVSGVVTDPGWLDGLSLVVDWGDGTTQPVMGVIENDRPNATLTFAATHVFGDNGAFTATLCGSDDDSTTCAPIGLPVNNVAPTAEIDEGGAADVCGSPAFIVHAGEAVSFSGRSTDPGSDDLFLSWDWDDGPPQPDVTSDYYVNNPVPGPDPLPSPQIDPRDVTDVKSHVFGSACLYNVGFLADDDDGGHGEDHSDAVIVGTASLVRSAGYWYQQYYGRGKIDFSAVQLGCYLEIVNHLSSVFSEVTAASTFAAAKEVLDPSRAYGDIRAQLDRQLLAVWLNFANGAIEHDELVDTNFDKVPDRELVPFLCTVEAARLSPATSRLQLERYKNLLEAINLSDKS